jgi:hypothetical protein
MLKKIKDWMHWRGLTLKNIVYASLALVTLCVMSGLLIYLVIMSTIT